MHRLQRTKESSVSPAVADAVVSHSTCRGWGRRHLWQVLSSIFLSLMNVANGRMLWQGLQHLVDRREFKSAAECSRGGIGWARFDIYKAPWEAEDAGRQQRVKKAGSIPNQHLKKGTACDLLYRGKPRRTIGQDGQDWNRLNRRWVCSFSHNQW